MQPNSRQYLWDILLYSGLGCFSYFFLVRFADIPLRYQDRLLTPEAFVAVMWYYSLSCRAPFFSCSITCCWYL